MPYAHGLLFSGGLCFAVPLSGVEATLGSRLIAVQHVYGSFGIPLRHSVAVADRHEVSLYTEWEDPFPSEYRAGGSRVVLERHRVGKQGVESVSLCLGTVQEQAGTSTGKGMRGSG